MPEANEISEIVNTWMPPDNTGSILFWEIGAFHYYEFVKSESKILGPNSYMYFDKDNKKIFLHNLRFMEKQILYPQKDLVEALGAQFIIDIKNQFVFKQENPEYRYFVMMQDFKGGISSYGFRDLIYTDHNNISLISDSGNPYNLHGNFSFYAHELTTKQENDVPWDLENLTPPIDLTLTT